MLTRSASSDDLSSANDARPMPNDESTRDYKPLMHHWFGYNDESRLDRLQLELDDHDRRARPTSSSGVRGLSRSDIDQSSSPRPCGTGSGRWVRRHCLSNRAFLRDSAARISCRPRFSFLPDRLILWPPGWVSRARCSRSERRSGELAIEVSRHEPLAQQFAAGACCAARIGPPSVRGP